MKQNIKNMLTSDSRLMLLWGVTTLCLVFTGAYVFRHKAFLSSQVQFDPNRLIQIEPNEAALKAYVAADQNLMEAMKADNIIAKAPPKTNPVKDVDIIGQEVIINGKLYKVGDKVGDAEIMAITAKNVTVQWNGKSTTFSPINGQDQAGGASGSGQRPGSSNRRPQPSGTRSRSGRTVVRGEGGGSRGRMTPPSPEDIQRLQKMSPDERRAFMEARMNSRRR
jgi:hypothetical protein